MTRAHKLANLLGVVLPFVGLVAAIGLLWNTWVSWTDLTLLAVGYVLTGVGITVGYHRLFTHRAFQTRQWVRWTFAILGSMAVEGPVLVWVADHRKHHQFSDVEGDPHSPHTARRQRLRRRGEEPLPCARRLAVRRRRPRGAGEVRAGHARPSAA